MSYTTRETCRVCGSNRLAPLFSLGEQFVSDFVEKDRIQDGIKAPVELELCFDCTLVQLKHTAPQELLYSGHYWYKSGVTETMRKALKDVVRAAVSVVELQPGDVVLDIGSNDGTLLREYRYYRDYCSRNVGKLTTVGFEPATNLMEEGAVEVDIFINDFWSAQGFFDVMPDYVRHVERPVAKIVTACGMFYDLEDPNEFIKDVSVVLAPDGIFIAQLMCLKNMLNANDVGNICHEHLEFYSLESLDYLFGKHGMEIIDIETNSVNGASYRLFVRLKGGTTQPNSGAEIRLEQAHKAEEGLDDPNYYKQVWNEMECNRQQVRNFIRVANDSGKKVWVYGASTKGNTILQYYGLTSKEIQGAAERSPAKYGKYTIGTGIPIHSREHAREQMPDYFLVLPYTFINEFVEMEKDEEWRKRGGKFIVPMPSMRVL